MNKRIEEIRRNLNFFNAEIEDDYFVDNPNRSEVIENLQAVATDIALLLKVVEIQAKALEKYANQTHPIHGDLFNVEYARQAQADVEQLLEKGDL